LLPIEVPTNFRIIAHRGASAYAPENTHPAFALAKKMGIKEVELDTQLSTDGVVVLCHDVTLERYGQGAEAVETLPSEALLSLDMGSWFSPYFFSGTPMLTLDKLLAEFGASFLYHIELKGQSPALPAAVFKLVEKRELLARSIFTSFSFDQLIRMREVSADCRLGWLVRSFDGDTFKKAGELELFQLCPRADRVAREVVEQGRDAVREMRAWGLRGEPREVRALIRQVLESGCDGMTINWPDWVTQQRLNCNSERT